MNGLADGTSASLRCCCERAGGSNRHWLAVDVELLPELEHDQAPEARAVVGAAGRVLAQEAPDSLCPEERPAAGALAEQDVAGELAQILAEPARDGHAEALLAARQDLGRQVGGERPSQRDLADPAARLEVVGEGEPELDDVVVEQG